jgi:hypothetical protein
MKFSRSNKAIHFKHHKHNHNHSFNRYIPYYSNNNGIGTIFSIIIILFAIVSFVLIILHYNNKLFTSSRENMSSNQSILSSISKSITNLFTTTPIKGYYNWTWGGGAGSGNPTTGDWDFGVLFGGEVPRDAININIGNSSKITAPIKFLDIGGGNDTGIWNLTDFDYVNSKLADIKKAGWHGLCFDIEVCPPNIDFISAFNNCFKQCKANGLLVLVTISRNIPYSCKTGPGQGQNLVNSWLQNSDIDYISPQLYGEDGETLVNVDLSLFSGAIPKIIPSIPWNTDWEKIQNMGVTPSGYIAWKHEFIKPSVNYCGSSWSDANTNCKTASNCVSQDSECPSGQKCFTGITCGSAPPPPAGKNVCGTDWSDASNNCSSRTKCPGGVDSECPTGQKCYGGIITC